MTTYGGVFAGVNSAVVDRAGKALSDMLQGQDESAMALDISKRVEEPQRFDFRAARSRASLLAMARLQDEGDLDGAAHRALADGVGSAVTLSPIQGRVWFNLVVERDHDHLRALRDALRRQAGSSTQIGDTELLESVGIAVKDKGTIEELLQKRRIRLLASERAFVQDLGLDWREVTHRST